MLKQITSRPELVIVALMIVIVAMLIIPLPPILIDVLIGLNIAISMMVFIGSFYLKSILDFSSFPSVLLITTVFRLALSITTSRMILLEADAGKIIETFGTFVIGGDLLVGMVVFLIVTLVQFIVITKGSERVAEVCARFSLDGLPGKQMSIDADVRAGSIDNDEAARRRRNLESESQLFGSLDGAMKFIKGDAIAGIIIIFVNFIGGVAVGTQRLGISFSEAIETFTLLTIGDGLVAQIPALLISVGAGFVVTRVNSDETNLGKNILKQIAGQNNVLIIVAILCLLIGILPGFPIFVFIGLTSLLVAVIVRRNGGLKNIYRQFQDSRTDKNSDLNQPIENQNSPTENDLSVENLSQETVPLALLVPSGQLKTLESLQFAQRLQKEAFMQLGIRVPVPLISESIHLELNEVALLVNEVKAETKTIIFGKNMVMQNVEKALALKIPLIEIENKLGSLSYWCSDDQKESLLELGIRLRPFDDELVQSFICVAARNASEYFGIQETRNLLDSMEGKYPELLKETFRNAPVQRIAQILQRLLAEQISIRNLKVVLEAIAQWAPKERDNILLAEHVRNSLARYVTDKLTVNGQINAIVMTPETESKIRQGVKQTATGGVLQMSAEDSDELLDAVGKCLKTLYQAQENLVIVTAMDIRRFAKRLLENRFPDLQVMSFNEISDQGQVKVLRTL